MSNHATVVDGTIRKTVFVNLDNAFANGAFEADGHLCGSTPDDIAYDLIAFAADCEDFTSDQILPFVEEWLQQEGETP